MFKLLHVWSSKEATRNEKKNWDEKKKFSEVLQCVKLKKKKLDKINFYKFIWVYWRMKKNGYIYFFGCFPVEEMKINK